MPTGDSQEEGRDKSRSLTKEQLDQEVEDHHRHCTNGGYQEAHGEQVHAAESEGQGEQIEEERGVVGRVRPQRAEGASLQDIDRFQRRLTGIEPHAVGHLFQSVDPHAGGDGNDEPQRDQLQAPPHPPRSGVVSPTLSAAPLSVTGLSRDWE